MLQKALLNMLMMLWRRAQNNHRVLELNSVDQHATAIPQSQLLSYKNA